MDSFYTLRIIIEWPLILRAIFNYICPLLPTFSFSPEFCPRPYQNSGHTGGFFFFTRILSLTLPKFRTYRRVFLFHQNFVPDRTKIQDIHEGLFFTIIFSPTVPKFRTYMRVFFFHQNFVPDRTKIQDIQEGLSFPPEFCPRPYKNSGHTGGSFFHHNFFPTVPKFRTNRRVFLFQKNFVPNHTKIQDIQKGLSFSLEFCPRLYQNSGHTGGSFFSTRILSSTIPKFRTHRRVFLFHQNFLKETPYEKKHLLKI